MINNLYIEYKLLLRFSSVVGAVALQRTPGRVAGTSVMGREGGGVAFWGA